MHTCPWCQTHYVNWMSSCTQCGGPLARPPGMDAGPPPPAAPRAIPRRYARRVTWNVFTLVGLGFSAFGLLFMTPMVLNKMWQAVFPGFFALGGLSMFFQAWKKARGTLRAFRHGTVAEGKVRRVQQDRSVQVNGECPWKLTYHYAINDIWHEGQITTFDSTAWERNPGQPLWVLYDQSDPDISAIYPPLG